MYARSLLVLVAGLGLGLPASAAAPARIANPAQAPATRNVTLAEIWRTGGDDDDVILGQVGNGGVDAHGNVYILDTQLAQVQVYSLKGRHLRTLGREGQGPGEMTRPVHFDVRADGSVAVVQPFPGKIITLNADGTPGPAITLASSDPTRGGLAVILGARERAGNLVVSGMRNSFGGDSGQIAETRFLATLDQQGQERKRHAELSLTRNPERLVFDEQGDYFVGDRGHWDLGPDGRLYLTPRFDAYEIEVRTPAGDPEQLISRPHVARQRSKAEIEEMRGGRQMNINGREPEIVESFAEHDPCIASLTVLDDGTLWVENSHARDRWSEHGEIRYDVFGPDGKLREEVAVTVPQGGEGHRLILLRDGRFLLVRGQGSLSVTIQAGSGGGHSSSAAAGDADAVPLELVCFARP
jgi:hypothetical protein